MLDVSLFSVDVVIFTHNHEDFIEQAIRGVAAQDFAGCINVRVHDDCSSDATAVVAERVLKRTGMNYSIHSPPMNQYQLGSMFRWEFIRESNADFIALLDGDDYWTDPKKLELQVTQLQRFNHSVLCHHTFSGVQHDGSLRSFRPPPNFCVEELPGVALADHNFIGTSTVVLRRAMLPKSIPVGFNDCRVDDYPLWAFFSSGRSICFVDREMSRYRLHDFQNYATQPERVRLDQLLMALVVIANAVETEDRTHWLEQVRRVSVQLHFLNRHPLSTLREMLRIVRQLRT